ncbi:MAG: chalcone isomerase family protein [Proteobacteria bacterium]|nr:chalcone isomerase family protein [Pseudomonadota bacterium]
MPKLIIVALLAVFFSGLVHAKNFIPDAQQIGAGKLSYFIWHIYDISLHAAGAFSFDKPFFLTLNYKIDLEGEKIADRSVEEIRKLGFSDEAKLADWYLQMRAIFPDVEAGSSLTGIYQPNQATVFYADEKEVGTINDAEFGQWFFGIWLNKNTSVPALRQQLLGGSNGSK